MIVQKSKLRKKADILFSKYIRQRDGRCLKCGKTGNLQCAHIIGRRNYRLRYDPQNSISLCYACHIHWAHKEPLDFTDWLEETYPERLTYLRLAKREIEKPDYEEIIKNLNQLISVVPLPSLN